MSQENVDVLRKAADALNSGGVEALLQFFPEDVVLYPFPDAPETPAGPRPRRNPRGDGRLE